MIFSYNWIKQLIPELNETPEKVAELLSRSLAEVEEVKMVQDDYILEIENKALGHRADLFGHVGIAREVSAVTQKPLTEEKASGLDETSGKVTHPQIDVSLPDNTLSQRYSATIINGISVTESPEWLKKQLHVLGQKPINNVVDVTNYLMLKYGQPLHAFDVDKLDASDPLAISVRLAKSDETVTLLDGAEISLTEEDLVIAQQTGNTSKPIALAGVMGGQSSQITQETKNIMIESANFDMFHIRATSRRHAKRTEASMRFEKGVDPELTTPVLIEAVMMLTGQEIDSAGIADTYDPLDRDTSTITTSTKTINQYLNTELSTGEIQKMLEYLGFLVEIRDEALQITIPTFRRDVSIKEDLYEEVGRLYDYNNITPTLPQRSIKPAPTNELWEFSYTIRDILSRVGFNEIISYSFVDKDSTGLTVETKDNEQILLSKYDHENLTLSNAIAPEHAYMRSSLIPSIAEKVVENAKRYTSFGLFEIGRVTHPTQNSELPDEPTMLSFIVYDQNATARETMLHTKQVWATLCNALSIMDKTADLQPLTIQLENTKGSAFGYEISLEELIQHTQPTTFTQIPLSPPTMQDISFIVTESTPTGTLITDIKNPHSYAEPITNQIDQWLRNVEIVDMYQSDDMKKESKHSLTIRLTFQDLYRSLSDEEVSEIRQQMEKRLIKQYNATIR